ncbi:MAG: PIN domain-containing protein [Gemmatimonadaceae bacterium]
MNVLVDTSVWSLALRRAKALPSPIVRELAELVSEARVEIVGPVRQELLSGVTTSSQFDDLREHLRAFPDLELETADFEEAAQMYNRCRSKGIQGSNTDFLMCAVAVRRNLAIFTIDGDFAEFRRAVPIALHSPRS